MVSFTEVTDRPLVSTLDLVRVLRHVCMHVGPTTRVSSVLRPSVVGSYQLYHRGYAYNSKGIMVVVHSLAVWVQALLSCKRHVVLRPLRAGVVPAEVREPLRTQPATICRTSHSMLKRSSPPSNTDRATATASCHPQTQAAQLP